MTDDWAYCRAALQRHSRTFAIPIAMLTPPLERGVTCAYLLCRIADTIEDTAAWSIDTKEVLYRSLLDLLEGRGSAQAFVSAVGRCQGGDEEELALLCSIERVMNVFGTLEPDLQQSCRGWIAELTRGMCIYSHRSPGRDGITCLNSVADLERYCYFVAGAIGQLLTDVFVSAFEPSEKDCEVLLRRYAERFGSGLQLVNIIRDITADLGRRCCFVPRTLLQQHGLTPELLVEPQHYGSAKEALGTLFELADSHLGAAFEYIMAVPVRHKEIRIFALIPLWLAIRTLQLCQTDPELLMPERRVKLERSEVMQLIQQCSALAHDNNALRSAFERLKAPAKSVA